MLPQLRRAAQQGFTLVELLIVVIILAILAAIVIPQFNSATDDTKLAALDSNLAGMRSAIELYKAQHGAYPGSATSGGGGTCNTSGTAGNGAVNTAQALIDQLVMYSSAAGATCTVGDTTTYKYGPYVRKSLPNEPINGKGSAAADITISTGGTITVGTTGGWAFDTKSGQILMNSSASDGKGSTYSAH